ncbi:MAG: FHA domain-containing protein [Myxococcota bacterium]
MLRLSVSEQGAPPRLMTFNQAQVHVGRASDCELSLGGKGISSRHCRFTRTPQGVVLEDLGSTNGTYVNRQKVTQPVTITSADEVIIAMYEVRIVEDGAVVSVAPMSMPPAAARPPAAVPRQATGVVPPAFATGGPAVTPPSMPPSGAGSLSSTGAPSMPPGSTSSAARPAVASDADWARQWEKLDSLAREWIASGKDRKQLLRGDKLTHARTWLASGRGKTPVPKKEHRDFIFASSRARQMRIIRNVTIGGLVLSIGVVGAIKIVQIVGGDDDGQDEIASADSGGSDGDEGKPKTKPRRTGSKVADAAVAAAANVQDDDPALATLIATTGLSELAPDARATPVEAAFREAIGKLRGQPMRGHDESITALDYTPDGRWAVSASKDGSVRLWNRTGEGSRRPTVLRGHSRGVSDLLVSLDSKFLFTAGENGKILRWDLSSDEVMSAYISLGGHTTSVGSLALSRDGRWLVSGSSDGSVRVWNASSPVPKSRRFDGHGGPIRAVAINATGTRVLAASQDGTASIWKANEGAPGKRTVLQGGTEEEPAETLDIDISGDGRWVITGHSNGVARLWDPSRRIPSLTARTLQGHEGPVPHVAITPDSTLAITAGDDHKLRIWNLEAKDPSLSAPTFDLHEAPITDLVAVSDVDPTASPRRRIAATASADGTVRSWNLERRDHEQDSTAFPLPGGKATAVALSADGQFILGGASTGDVRQWPAASAQPPGASAVGWGHTQQVLAVATNPVGTRMVSGSADGTAKVWDLTRPGRAGLIATLDKHTGQVAAVAVSPNGQFVATGDSNGAIRVWDLTKPDPSVAAVSLDKHRRGISKLGFSKDSTRLVSLSIDAAYVWKLTQDPASTAVKLSQKDELVDFALADGSTLVVAGVKQLRLYDLSSADIPGSAKGLKRAHGLDVLAVGISPDGRWAASSAKDASTILWDLEKSGKANEIVLHEKPVDAIAFSPDGQWLATGSQDNTVRLWDLRGERPHRKSVMTLRGAEQRVSALRFSADGRYLVSASNDRTIRVYDLSLSDEATVVDAAVALRGHGDVIASIAVSEDGSTVISGSYDRSARAWPLTASRLSAIGCERVGRSLTPDEWETYFGDASFRRPCG